jgi:hypothetical protein
VITNQLKDMKCPYEECSAPKVTKGEVKRLLLRLNEKELAEKLDKFAGDTVDLYTRFCMRPGCETKMRATDMNVRKMTCPDCG